ncbi:hypothetical protein BKA70DRAFT_1439090 [Coprinopsis sp. MPI-PUGE-AT-0042]|nr:hypothetical protein BKA70DRAFT_1439090 [Coprinopsis sp. MPI-PUGE-AT-0042]
MSTNTNLTNTSRTLLSRSTLRELLEAFAVPRAESPEGTPVDAQAEDPKNLENGEQLSPEDLVNVDGLISLLSEIRLEMAEQASTATSATLAVATPGPAGPAVSPGPVAPVIAPIAVTGPAAAPIPAVASVPAAANTDQSKWDLSALANAAAASATAHGSRYTITKGHQVGWLKGWTRVQPLVNGVSGSCCKGQPSQAAARAAFEEALAMGTVEEVD